MNITSKPKLRRGAAVAVVLLLAVGGAMLLLRPPTRALAPSAPASAMTVEVVTPDNRVWPRTLQGSGPVTAWQEIIVSPETGGYRIAELMVDVGATVRRG